MSLRRTKGTQLFTIKKSGVPFSPPYTTTKVYGACCRFTFDGSPDAVRGFITLQGYGGSNTRLLYPADLTGPLALPSSTPTPTPVPADTPTPTAPPLPSSTPTAPPTATPVVACVCDCNVDEQVTVNELIRAVHIALESAPVAECPAADASGDGAVVATEIIAGANNALTECPAS